MNLKELYNYSKKELNEEHEALIFMEEILDVKRTDIILNSDKKIERVEPFLNAVQRRKNGEPLQYILGYWYFDNLKLLVKDGVLIPREDTLVLVDCACENIKENSVGVDLCSGTGAVALAIADRCNSVKIDAVELYDVPFECLGYNIDKYGENAVKAVKGDVFELYKSYKNLDFIVSNPPYIKSEEISTLQKEVTLEPHTALDGGNSGLDFYEAIISNWTKTLKKGGLMAFEIGESQAAEVKELMLNQGYTNINILKDFNGLDRVVYGIK